MFTRRILALAAALTIAGTATAAQQPAARMHSPSRAQHPAAQVLLAAGAVSPPRF